MFFFFSVKEQFKFICICHHTSSKKTFSNSLGKNIIVSKSLFTYRAMKEQNALPLTPIRAEQKAVFKKKPEGVLRSNVLKTEMGN